MEEISFVWCHFENCDSAEWRLGLTRLYFLFQWLILWSMGPRHEMALNPSSERIMGVCFKQNLSTTLIGPLPVHFVGKYPSSNWAPCSRLLCSSVRKDASVSESKRNAPSPLSVSVEEELDHVVRFKISDFKILDCVSTGLGGRVWGCFLMTLPICSLLQVFDMLATMW